MAESEKQDKKEEKPQIKTARFTEFYRKKYMPEFDKLKGDEKKVYGEFEKSINDGEQKAIDRSLKTSIKEGAAANIMVGTGEQYISPFMVSINATASQIAGLTALTNLIGPLSQLITPSLIEKRSRKSIVFLFVLLQALMWIPIIASIFLFIKGYKFVPILIIILWAMYSFFGNFVSPAWNSWMGDLVPADKRGKYFGKRSSICETVLLIATITSAFFLDYSKKANIVFYCFASLFFIAMCARVVSSYLIRKQYEPELNVEKGYYFSFFEFVKRMKGNNFGRFVLYRVLFAAAVNISGPFFVVYTLRELGFSYMQYTIAMIIIPVLVHIIVWPFFGRISDKFGNLKLISMFGILASIYPILWLFSKNYYYIALFVMVINGIGWAAVNLATSNFIFDAVTRQKRSICFAYFSVLIGFGVFIGATIGGILIKLNISFMNKFLFIFLISGVLRVLAITMLSIKVKEVRKVEKSKSLISYIYPFSKFNRGAEQAQTVEG